MGLIDDLAAEEAGPSSRCGISTWLDTLDVDAREAWVDAYRRGVATTSLHRVASKNGLTKSLSLMRSHLRGECGCVS